MSVSGAPEARWLGDAFVLFHDARGDTGVLLCPPFGWEEMCSYRARRDWAHALAQAGHPCARLDLPGSGNATGSPRDADRLTAWTRSVTAAAEWLRARTRCRRVIALGAGLGGFVAALATQEGAPIDDLILWGVPARGRALVRELRAYSAVVAASLPEDTRPDALADGELELTGFVMSAETAAALEASRLDPASLGARAGRRVLLIGRDGLGVDQRLAEGLRAAGADVETAGGDDYGVFVGHPQETGAPDRTIARTLEWLAGAAPRECATEENQPIVDQSQPRGPGGREPEEPVELAGCFGILTGARATPAPLAAVWLGAGALHHIGPHRLWVEAARRWAERGIPTLRLDLPGIGESSGPAPRPLPDSENYGPERAHQALAVIDALHARGVAERFILGGLCAGAYWALHAALADPRVAGTLLINLYAFDWSEQLVVERGREQTLNAFLARASRGRLRSHAATRQDGQVFWTPAGEEPAAAWRKLSPGRLRSALIRPVQRAQRPTIEAALHRLRDQGTETLLLLSRGEGLRDQLARQGVLGAQTRWPNLTIEAIPSRDHLFRALWLQRHVHAALDRALERTLERVLTAQSARLRGGDGWKPDADHLQAA